MTRLAILAGVLAAIAYRDLLGFDPADEFARDVERWLFLPAETAPLVVIALSGWLLYRRRGRLARLPSGSAPGFGIGLIVPGALAFAWATYTNAPDLLVPSLMLYALGFAALLGGLPAVRCVLLPVGFLVFAMPLPAPLLSDLIFRLQLWTAEYASLLLRLLGEPYFLSGDLIHRAGQTFIVIESCSGLRSIETLTMLAILQVDLFGRRGLHAVLVVAAAPLVAFAMNGFRALTLILNPHSEIVAIHNLQGIAILLCGMILIYALDGFLGVALRPAGASSAREDPHPRSRWAGPAVVAVLAVSGAVSFLLPRYDARPPVLADLSERMTRDLGSWSSTPLEPDPRFLGRAGFRQIVYRRYSQGVGPDVDAFVGVGFHEGRLLTPFSPKTGYPGSGWTVESEEQQVLEPGGHEVTVRVMRSGSRTRLVYHWYEGSAGLLGETLRSLVAIDQSPFARREPALVVRLEVELGVGKKRGLQAAKRHLETFHRKLESALNGVSPPA